MGNNTVISCQLSFYPLGTEQIRDNVNEVLKIIEESGLEKETNEVGTTIFGEASEVYSLLEKITVEMDEKDLQYALSINISNSCGCRRF